MKKILIEEYTHEVTGKRIVFIHTYQDYIESVEKTSANVIKVVLDK